MNENLRPGLFGISEHFVDQQVSSQLGVVRGRRPQQRSAGLPAPHQRGGEAMIVPVLESRLIPQLLDPERR